MADINLTDDNRTEMSCLDYGYKLYDFIDDGILYTVDLNKEINSYWFSP